MGFVLVLITSMVVGIAEYRASVEQREHMARMRAQVERELTMAPAPRSTETIASELRLLRLQLQQDDLADRVFENPWFQLLGALGTALVAMSFLYEARAKWPRKA